MNEMTAPPFSLSASGQPAVLSSTGDTTQPGLLDVFRLFGWLQVGIAVIYVVAITLASETLHFAALVPLASAGGLLFLITSGRVQGWLQRRHVQVALIYAVVHVVVGFGLLWHHWVTLALLGNQPNTTIDAALLLAIRAGMPPSALLSREMSTSLALLVVLSNLFFLLLLVSWQYDMRRVLWFCAATTALDLVFNVLPIYSQSIQVLPNIGIILFRNLIFIQVGSVIRHLLTIQYEQRATLVQANHQLSRYAAAAEELAISRERNRLARELHDTLAHTLSAASVQLEAAQARWTTDADKARTAVEKTLAITRAGLNETRRALKALRASPLDDLGLRLALVALVETMQGRSAAVITFDVPASLPVCPHDVEQTVYRAAQEALENAVRHAHARRIAMTLQYDARSIRLIVCDDGAGFDPHRALLAEDHFGLRGLHERALALGGTLHIVSQPGQGSTLTLEIAQ